MSRTARVTRMETAIAAVQHRQPMDWEAHGPLGSLTRECISLFLHREDPLDAYGHQLMMVGSLALDCISGRMISAARVEADRQLMADPKYRAHGWSEQKHPDALALFALLVRDGYLK